MRFIILWLTIALDIGVFSMPSVDEMFPSQMELNKTEFEFEYTEYQTGESGREVDWETRTVEDCILLELAGQIVLQPDPDDANTTVTMEIPVGTTASGTCNLFRLVADPMKGDPAPTQRITLNWSEDDKEGATLWRNITIEFSRNDALQNYGVSKMEAVYEVKQFQVVKNTMDPATNETIPTNVTVTEFVSMSTFKMQPWAFLVPLNRSYFCTDNGRQTMHTELHRSDEHPGEGGVKLAEAVLSVTKVQLDAFRVGVPEDEFQVSMDCTQELDDNVHIIGEANLPALPDDIQPLPITGQANLPTLPEAIQLFQLQSMNNLRQTIQHQEGVIRDQVTRIAELEGILVDKDLLIVLTTEEGRREKVLCETEKAQLKEDFAAEKEEEKNQCDAKIKECETEKTRAREEFAAKNEKEKERCKAEKERYLTEKTQLEEEFIAKNVEEKERCEAEQTQLRAEFTNQILEKETKCEEARMEVESQTTQESERMENILQQCKSTIIYMGNVMLQNNQGMLEGQRLLESQAETIKEANEEIKRQRDGLLICEVAANSTVLQAETISLLRSSINRTLNLPWLSTSDLEQLDVASFMLEMAESHNKQTKTIEDLNSVLEKGNTLEERMFEVAEGLTNLTSIMESATVNLNIVEQQALVIQNQAKSIAQLTPLLKHTSEDVIWYNEKTSAESVSSCSCLPRSEDSTRPIPARIEYSCGDLSDRTFSLPCSGGVCEAEALPSCTEPMDWEESVVAFQHCQETSFDGDTLFCSNGGNGTREMKTTSIIGGDVVEEVTVVPCLDCTDLLTWTDWKPCTDQGTERKLCRRRGDNMIGFEMEQGNMTQDSLLFITGGVKNRVLSSTETYPRPSDCSPPSLPLGRHAHTTFVTSEPSAVVAACGGRTESVYTDSCLVLDPIKERWDESRMGSLTMNRYLSAAATLEHIGVFIVGGSEANNARTSEFLAAGTMQWQEGPALPVGMWIPCAVEITSTSFLSIYGRDIREFDAAIAGPTSIEGWREAGRWPVLKRYNHPGCAKIGQKVIIAGGYYNGRSLSSTEVLDLVSRQITSGGEMATPRSYFHIATIISGGEEKMFALAGENLNYPFLNTVEEWVEENSTWKAAENLVKKRKIFGLVKAPRHLVCPL